MTRKIISRLTVLLPIVALLLAACTTQHDPRPTITVTIEPLRYFAERIGGDKFRVVTMVPNGANPETYEPTAQQMAALSESELYIMAGSLGFERAWMRRLQAAAPHIIVVDASQGIDHMQEHPGAPGDPHTWTSPANALHIAQNIYEAMRRVDAKDSAQFKARLDSLTWHIIDLDAEITRRMSQTSVRSFLIHHPTLTYFARDYNLRQMPVEREGHEPSPQAIKDLVDTARKAGTRVFFIQRQFDSHSAKAIAEETSANMVEIDPLSYDWDTELLKIADAMSEY